MSSLWLAADIEGSLQDHQAILDQRIKSLCSCVLHSGLSQLRCEWETLFAQWLVVLRG